MDSGTGTKTPHILLLEDDRAHQDLFLRAFRDDPEPFRVSVAGNILDARQVIGRDPPDLIIADWILPDGKGLDILPRRDGRVTIPLVIMTSFGDEQLAVEIMKSGAIDYVVKSATVFRDLPHIARRALREWENIHERIRAKEAVQDSQKRLADIIGFLPDAVLAIDNDGRVIAWNDAIERMTGVAAKDMIGKGDHEYSIPFYGERRPVLIDLVLMEDGEVEKKYDYIQRDERRITSETFIPTLYGGKGAYLWGTASPLFDSAGNRIGAIEVIRNITERRQAEESVREQKAILETLLNAPSDTIALLDRQGTIIDINEAGARRLGGTVQRMTGRCAYDLLPPDVANMRKEHIDRVFATGESAGFDDARSGTYLHNQIFPIFNRERTAVDRIAIFARDITDQKKSEQALQKSEDRFRHVSGLISDFAYSCTRSPEGGFLIDWITGAFRRITGYPEEEILVMGCWRGIVVEEDLPVFDGKIAGLLPGMSSRCELRIMSKDGAIKWLMCFAECISDPADTASHRLYGGCQDITDQREKDQALRESERKYRFLIDNVRDIVWQTTPDLTFTYLSRVAETLTGYSPGDLIGTSLLDLLTESSARVVRERLRERMEEYSHGSRDLATVFEIEITQKIGGTRWLEVSANAVFGPGGSLEGFQGISRDITERKRTETALIESEVRFRDLFNNMGAGVAIYDVVDNGEDFIFKNINSAVEKIEKVKKEDVAGRRVLEVFPGVKDFGLFSVLQRVARTGVAESHPVSIYRDNRISGWRENYVYKLPSGEIVAIYEDVTEQKQAEEKLRESEERYRALLFGAGIGVGYWSMDGTLLFLNEISYKRLKGTEKDFIGKSMQELFGDNADVYRDRIRKAAVSPEPMEYEDYISLPVGKGWYLSVYTRISRPDGSVMGIQVLSMDITERKQAEDIRKAYEARLDSAMEIGSLAWWEMDLPDGAVRFDDRKAAMLGYPPEKFRHFTDFTSLLHPDDYEPAMKAMRDHLEGRESRYHSDYRIRSNAGTYRWFRDVGGVTKRHADGSPATITGIVIDISASKEAEEALRSTEIRFRALIQNSSDIIRILDRDGRIVYESPSAERILGYPAGFLIGVNPMEYIHPDDLERVKNDFSEVIDSVNPGTPTEFRIRKADGKYIWVDSIGINLLEVPGVNGIVITTRPIQQRKEAEQALRENEARLATAMDIAGLVNWEFDVATGMFTFDDRFYTLYATTAEREGGNLMSAEVYMQEFVYPEDRPEVLASIRKILATTNPDYFGQMEHRITPRDGSVRTIISRFAPVMGPDGKVIRTYGANQDITDLKLMEAEIRSLNTTLEQRVKDRTEALSRVNEALEAEIAQRLAAEKKLQASFDEKVTLLKEVHHRVKNNLQIIASLLNLQSRYIKDESSLAVIRESQNRIKAMALVHEKLYRAEDISHISLSDYIRFLGTGLFQFYDARSRGIQFILDIHEVNVDIDAAIPLGLIMNELISNSLKYAFPQGRKGEIAISVKKEGHTLTVVYRDTGIGIPAEMDWRNTQSLGLRLVNTLVDQLNGTVELDQSAGTEFTMVLHEKE